MQHCAVREASSVGQTAVHAARISKHLLALVYDFFAVCLLFVKWPSIHPGIIQF
jgi:hypothetical protein